MLNIILTSWNRPNLIKRTIDSLLAQTSDQWRLWIQDDGSYKKTRDIIEGYCEQSDQITAYFRKVSKADRERPARYSLLINELLPTFTDGVIGYLCDNAEYHPDTVQTVLAFFDSNPDVYAGYTDHLRDAWQADGIDGVERIGSASDFGHWNRLPPRSGPQNYPQGVLDHSQVFHRAPCDIEWPEIDPADGYFFNELVRQHGDIMPIAPGQVLTYEHLLK